MASSITTKQNEPGEIRKLRAQRCLHSRAKRIVGVQVVLTAVLPVAGAVAVAFRPELKGSVAFYSLLISFIDLAVLEPWQKSLQTKAAKVQEAFDCSVLDLPWADVRVGSPPEEEDIHSASNAHLGGENDDTLRDWYPAAAGDVPSPLARIICQRANLRWDADLRRRYRNWLAGILLVVGIAILATGLHGGFNVEQLTLRVLAPLSPVLFWGIRECRKQGEAAATSDRLRSHVMSLWAAAMERKLSDEELRAAARELQSEIYRRRATAPVIFDRIYNWMRTSEEEEMNVAAAELVRDARRHGF